MSIIYIDNIIFNDEPLTRQIQYRTTFFFMILNVLSLLMGLIFIIFYSKVLSYQNTQSNNINSHLHFINISFNRWPYFNSNNYHNIIQFNAKFLISKFALLTSLSKPNNKANVVGLSFTNIFVVRVVCMFNS